MLPSASPGRGMIADEEEMMRVLEMLTALSNQQQTAPPEPRQGSPINPTDVAFEPAGEPGAPTQEVPGWLLELADRLGSQEFQSWMEPFEGVSQAIGGAIRGKNPFTAAARIGSPTTSDALIERGAPDWAALLAELGVPDPVGASKIVDLLPLALLGSRGVRGIANRFDLDSPPIKISQEETPVLQEVVNKRREEYFGPPRLGFEQIPYNPNEPSFIDAEEYFREYVAKNLDSFRGKSLDYVSENLLQFSDPYAALIHTGEDMHNLAEEVLRLANQSTKKY